MKITSKGRYAVLAMVDIAKFGENNPCNCLTFQSGKIFHFHILSKFLMI